MSADYYLSLVNTPFANRIAKQLGLPRPAELRRYQAGGPLVPGPILVMGEGSGADLLAAALLRWGQDVRRHPATGQSHGAVVVALDTIETPADLAEPLLELGAALRGLTPGGRVVTISRSPAGVSGAGVSGIAQASARHAVFGAVRSLARELRGGATANGIVLHGDVPADAPGALRTLEFFLSGKSAYVDGQFVDVQAPGALGASLECIWTPAEHSLAGKVAVVTGAARGIGAATVNVLRREGATVIAVDVPAASGLLAEVANRKGATALQLDITAEDAGARITSVAAKRFGALDIFVHNAGITRDKLFVNMTADRWRSVMAVNLEAQLAINQVLVESETFAQDGRIICVASTSGIAGNKGQGNYAASKAGVIGMVESTARQLAGSGRTINAVAPGFIETEMTANIPLLTREVARRLSSLQQGGLPGDVAETIGFLAAGNDAEINGQVVRVCGQHLVGA